MNYYGIILLLVVIAGITVAVWGWNIMIASRKIRQWPTVDGKIERSTLSSNRDDLLPDIRFSYVVKGQQYSQSFEFPADIDPMPEMAQSYIEKYPAGEKVRIYYNPLNPAEATLEPAVRGDWMIMALGVITAVGGLLALFVSF